MAGYRVAIPLQFIRKVYIGSVNMAADFEIDYHYCPVKAGKSVFEIVET